jgi:hypothetical protein
MANLTPRLQRGMGHLPGPFPEGTMSTKHLFGARRAGLSGDADLTDYVDQIRDQKQTSRCVGAANARTLHIVAQRQKFGAPNPPGMPYPSERGLYSLAREEEGVTGDEELLDHGSVPGLLVAAITQDIGVPLERDFPEDDALINERVPAEVLAAALSIKVKAVHLIDSDGAARVDDAVQMLLEGFPFTMAMPVGPDYENCSSETPVEAAGAQVFGGHDIAIVGVKTVNGRRFFKNAGSWGQQFGFGGYVWLAESCLTDPRASDFIVPTVITDWS